MQNGRRSGFSSPASLINRKNLMCRFLFVALVSASLLTAETPVESARALLRAGLADPSAERRTKAARALGLITNNQEARQWAEKALSDAKPDVRAAAADSLGQMNAKASVPKLVDLVKRDPDTSVVFAAASSLYTMGAPQANEFYYAVLTGQRKSGDSLVDSQMKMLQDRKALAQMGLQAGLGFVPFGSLGYTVFKTATKDDASPVRAAAAQKLIRDSDPKTADAMMTAAGDDKWIVRAAVINAIALRGDRALLKAVLPRLEDENDTVRFAAAAAVLRLTK